MPQPDGLSLGLPDDLTSRSDGRLKLHLQDFSPNTSNITGWRDVSAANTVLKLKGFVAEKSWVGHAVHARVVPGLTKHRHYVAGIRTLRRESRKPTRLQLLLGGSWDLVTGVINRVTIVIITYNPN